MRIWRALKALGCAALRDGVYLLPTGGNRDHALQGLADECTREGGSAWLMRVRPRTAAEAQAYCQLFDRHDEYNELRKAWKKANRTVSSLPMPELVRLQKKLRREYEALQATDFFAGEASVEAEAAWAEFDQRVSRLLSPDEPHEIEGRIPRLDASQYQGRLWATRGRPWVDRVASAWLIRRFIDNNAQFRWLSKPSDCPKRALGFDFDGATFTHVGDRVTFETLMASFGLDDNPALVRLAAIVHALDVGGEPIAEAQGFEAVLSGARERISDDDALLIEIGTVLDSLYAHFQRDTRHGTAKGKIR